MSIIQIIKMEQQALLIILCFKALFKDDCLNNQLILIKVAFVNGPRLIL